MEINQQQILVIPKDCDHNFLLCWHCFDLLMGRETRGFSTTLMLSSSQELRDAPTFRPLQRYGAGKKLLQPDISLNAVRVALLSSESCRPCIRQRRHLLTESAERYGTTSSICRCHLNAVIVYSI
ncbi:hypothetical protein AVEN_90197-1 [Araneus ventricosus]|uniref:Uncharacterized protein n=1 Tax=Araneus ventricosus TaxID=182803 RepID=A0A4Y2UQD0_ARAVE|nr:hypothetical protein AVEN_90197-1 [Araneus ventricosus]